MTKIFDLVDNNDKTIGTADVKECHSNPQLIHRVVHFTLVDKPSRKILLTRRSYKVRFDPGKLVFPGEHVLSGTTYHETVIKGVNDELGFTPKKFKEFGNKLFSYDKQTEFARFFVVYWQGEIIKNDTREIIDFKWLNLKTLIKGKDKYSTITKHWVSQTDWKEVLK